MNQFDLKLVQRGKPPETKKSTFENWFCSIAFSQNKQEIMIAVKQCFIDSINGKQINYDCFARILPTNNAMERGRAQ